MTDTTNLIREPAARPTPAPTPDREVDFVHTGPHTPSGRYLRKFWQVVMRASDIAPGEAKPIKIMCEDFTIYRGESGRAQVVAHRCPHRGTQLSAGYVEGDEIRCLYHGWKYRGDGQCTEMPAEGAAAAARVRVASYPTREHLGCIWAYFGGGEEPAFPPIPEFDDGGFVEVRVDVRRFNYFQAHENDFDPYHAVWTHLRNNPHADFNARMLPTDQPLIVETDYGILEKINMSTGPAAVITSFQPCTIRTMFPAPPGLYEDGVNMPYRDAYLMQVPIDDENHVVYMIMQVRLRAGKEAEYAHLYDGAVGVVRAQPMNDIGQAILDGRLKFDDVRGHPYFAVIEDTVAQGGQGRIADRKAEWLSKSDINIVQMRRIWAREVRAMEEGRPTKQWTVLQRMTPEMRESKADLEREGLA